ncbi:hypothetical protein [Sphingomonas sp. Leaf25]|uniref:hypothetical protein n=1 Tax=Sphingomonas sp. Leaf25 TaxID=1735692 RepID=UPI0006FF6E84|nr:hypothetical protein [Sphingomonas sp. Leaf25]KQN06390.1 hypothetical protein ASE78_15615 [Sphingomonas sp. Leaf25]
MRLSILLPGAIALAAMTLPAAARDRGANGEAALAKITAGRSATAPVSCINLRDIRSSEIVEDTAIVYRMNNGMLYVNRPEGGGLLDRDDILVTRTLSTRLCSIDIVTLVDRGSQMFSGSVALGEFVPYSRLPGRRG